MAPVEIIHIQGTVVLRARNSELLILSLHVKELRNLKQPKEFSKYFLYDALVNRSARKLFEAWLRKDLNLWPKLFDVIQNQVKDEDFPKDMTSDEAQILTEETAAKKAVSEKSSKSTKKVASSKDSTKTKKASTTTKKKVASADKTEEPAKKKSSKKVNSSETSADKKKKTTKKKTI